MIQELNDLISMLPGETKGTNKYGIDPRVTN